MQKRKLKRREAAISYELQNDRRAAVLEITGTGTAGVSPATVGENNLEIQNELANEAGGTPAVPVKALDFITDPRT